MIRFEKFSPEKHYEILKDWWLGHKWSVVPMRSLSKNGLMCYWNDIPVCSGFIYGSDSNIAWQEWLLCDPKADRQYRSECIDNLLDELDKQAKDMGYTVIFTSVRNASLMTRLENKGFQVSDTEMTNMVKVL